MQFPNIGCGGGRGTGFVYKAENTKLKRAVAIKFLPEELSSACQMLPRLVNRDFMTHPWLILQHVAWEGPGLIASEAKARGLRTEIRRLDLGASMPAPGEVDGLVVMGGPMGVYETGKYDFLERECKLIRDLVACDCPVLGVCLGAQLLASALGARVFPGHKPEIGFGSVQLTGAGNDDPLMGPAGPIVPVFHWHGDTFDLPQGATLLASSEDYPHQAFRFGKCAYGLQFHLEPDSGVWSAWQEHLPSGLMEESKERRLAIEQVGKGVIARFFDLASGYIPTSPQAPT